VAAAWRPYLLAGGVLFPMAESSALDPFGLGLAALLGVGAGLASGALTAMVYGSEDFFQRLPIHWMWWPMFGGLVIGLGGLIDPRALGVGYDNIQALLNGDMGAASAFTLILVKAVIWSVALGSGTSGGVLAPLLIMGGAFGAIVGDVLPTGNDGLGNDGLWALVGMAAMMGGTMRSPLTSMIFALELTHNIGAFLPLAIGCTMAHATTVLLLKRSILTEKVARRGHHVLREYIVDPFEIMRVGEIMAQPVDTLPAAMKIGEAMAFFTAPESPRRHKSYPVVDAQNRLVAMVSRADALRWTIAGWDTEKTLGEQLAGQNLTVGYADELVGALADRMADSETGRVPILKRGAPGDGGRGAGGEDGPVVGLVARRDLLRVRAEVIRHERDRERLIRLRADPERMKGTAQP
jgi:CBS domain-containing protein